MIAILGIENGTWTWVSYGLLISLIVGGLLAGYILTSGRKRTRRLIDVSLEIGFRFEGNTWADGREAPQRTTALFRQGGRVLNVMTGIYAGLKTSLFDYLFARNRSEGESEIHAQTIAAFRQEGTILPEFEMSPEGVLQKVENFFLRKDINFQSNPGFSSRFQLRGPEPDAIRAAFTPGLLSFCEDLEKTKKWRIEGIGDTLIVYRPGRSVKPNEFRDFLQETSQIANAFFQLSGRPLSQMAGNLR